MSVDRYTPIIVAIVGVLGSIFVAWITTGARFSNELESEKANVENLKSEIKHLQRAMELVKADVDSAKIPIMKIGKGEEVERNEVDKRFYSNVDCEIGKIQGAMLTLEKNNKPDYQAGICVCGDTPGIGKGWYCFD